MDMNPPSSSPGKSGRRAAVGPRSSDHGGVKSRSVRRSTLERTASADNARSYSSGPSPSSSSAPDALRRHLAALSLPPGFLPSVLREYRACASQVWLLDNSSKMAVRDAHVGRRCHWTATAVAKSVRGSQRVIHDGIKRGDDMRRWDELCEAVSFHALVATKVWLPTTFALLHSGDNGRREFRMCCGEREDAASELDRLRRTLPDEPLVERACPLAERLRSLAAGIRAEAPGLEANDQHVTVVVCTQGKPTDKEGRYSRKVQREFQKELEALCELPVKIIIRVCSDAEDVLDMYNSLDLKMDVDVLDDFWGEALEVYLHNPWLTYTMGMHRLRESGLAPFQMDKLDECRLGLTEIHMFAEMLLVNDGDVSSLPDPQRNYEGFLRVLKNLVEMRDKQWNSVRGKPTPWIDPKKVNSIYGGNNNRARERRPSWDHRSASTLASSKFAAQKSTGRPFTKSTKGVTPQGQELPSFKQSPGWSTSGRPRHTAPQPASGESGHQKIRGQQAKDPPSNERPSVTKSFSESRFQPPKPRYSKRPLRKTVGPSEPLVMDVDMSLSLEDILRQWSRKPPNYTSVHSLQYLLLTVPEIFPPINPKVEPHTYFEKWKSIDKEVFSDLDADELITMSKKALKKAKLFLHPDKLPKDATDNQTVLFKRLWEIFQEREIATFK